MNNYIVTFEYRVMVTAFAILEMFYRQTKISKNEKQKSTDDVRHGQLNVWLAIRFSGP